MKKNRLWTILLLSSVLNFAQAQSPQISLTRSARVRVVYPPAVVPPIVAPPVVSTPTEEKRDLPANVASTGDDKKVTKETEKIAKPTKRVAAKTGATPPAPARKAPVEAANGRTAPASPASGTPPPVKKDEATVVARPVKKPVTTAPVAPKPSAVITDENIVFRGELKGGLRRILLKSNAKWGYVNKDFIPVIAFRFERAFDFNGEQAEVEFEGKRRRINRQGDFIK